MRDKLLNGEISYNLREPQIIIETWRVHYNSKRPHASLGYRPPAPDVLLGLAPQDWRRTWPSIAKVALNPPLH